MLIIHITKENNKYMVGGVEYSSFRNAINAAITDVSEYGTIVLSDTYLLAGDNGIVLNKPVHITGGGTIEKSSPGGAIFKVESNDIMVEPNDIMISNLKFVNTANQSNYSLVVQEITTHSNGDEIYTEKDEAAVQEILKTDNPRLRISPRIYQTLLFAQKAEGAYENIVIKDCVFDSVGIKISSSPDIDKDYPTGVRSAIISGCTIRNSYNQPYALEINKNTENVRVINCTVHGISRHSSLTSISGAPAYVDPDDTDGDRLIPTTLGRGISVGGRNTLIKGCHVYDCAHTGISVGGSTQNTVVNNIIHDTGSSGLGTKNVNGSSDTSGTGGQATEGRNNIFVGNRIVASSINGIVCSTESSIVADNIVRDCSLYGILSGNSSQSGESSDLIVSGNLVSDSGRVGIELRGTHLTVSDSIVHGNKGGGIWLGTDDISSDWGCIIGNQVRDNGGTEVRVVNMDHFLKEDNLEN